MIEVQVGSPIPLTLQVFDGKEGLKVSAVLMDLHGKEFSRVSMNDHGNGLYIDLSVSMPDVDMLVAQYFANSEDYEVAQDIFKAIPKPMSPEKMLVGEVVAKGSWDDSIIGEVQSVEKEAQNPN